MQSILKTKSFIFVMLRKKQKIMSPTWLMSGQLFAKSFYVQYSRFRDVKNIQENDYKFCPYAIIANLNNFKILDKSFLMWLIQQIVF